MRKFWIAGLSLLLSLGLASNSFAEIREDKLGEHLWQGTTVFDLQGNDVTELNRGFVGLAKYDSKENRYEFFDKQTGLSREDMGIYFLTQDGGKRVLISETKNYNVVVEMTHLDRDLFVYERLGKVAGNEEGVVSVSHIPYEGVLAFSRELPAYLNSTGKIDKSLPGRDILASTLWQGTVVIDENGNDVSRYNAGFLGLAKYDGVTNRYEFFNMQTGQSRGDYGYYDVIRNNQVRTHVSLGMKYAASLELTELHSDKFTYTRRGKDSVGNEIKVYVEHVPYKGNLDLEFTF